MTLFSFTLIIEGGDVMADSAQSALFDAGCDDATFAVSQGVQTADFDREADTFADAVAGAIRAVESTVPDARVIEVRREGEVATPSSSDRHR